MGDLSTIKLKKLDERAIIPFRATPGSNGYDLFAIEEVKIFIREVGVIRTGIALEIPYGYEAQVRSRSGLAMKDQLFVLNSPGTIDSDYRGEIKVLIYNLGMENYTIYPGDKIAQLAFCACQLPEFNVVEELSETVRGDAGFGSTGRKKSKKAVSLEGMAEALREI